MRILKGIIKKHGVKKNGCTIIDIFLDLFYNVPPHKKIIFDVLLLSFTVVPFSYYATKNDLFERWYEYTRVYEDWDLDELSCVFISILFVFFVLAQIRLFAILRMHKKLKLVNQKLIEKERNDCRQKRMVALGTMASGLAHEINNALQPALGLGEFVREGLKENKDEKYLAYMNTIMNGVYHARGIVDNVLNYSHEKTLVTEEQWAKAVLLHSLNFCVSLIPSGTQCVWRGLNSIEGSDERLILRCNETGLSQILLNLMKNASDAMGGGGEIDILVDRCQKENDQGEVISTLCIKISDTGRGMDKETMQRIFEPFFTTKDVSKGTGLGLAGVYALVKQHNGKIKVESVPGEGTTFTLLFPVTVKSRVEAQKIINRHSEDN